LTLRECKEKLAFVVYDGKEFHYVSTMREAVDMSILLDTSARHLTLHVMKVDYKPLGGTESAYINGLYEGILEHSKKKTTS